MKGVLLTAVLGILITMAPPAAARKWMSEDGQFSTEAEFVEFAEGKVKLKKASGETILVPIERLSAADRRFIVHVIRAKKRTVPDTKAVSYLNDVQPFLVTYCAQCHNEHKAEQGYDVTTFDTLMRIGKKGAMVVPGKPEESRLILTLEGKGDLMPPPRSPQPTDDEVAKILAWIEAGAPDDSGGPGQRKLRTKKLPR